MSEPQRHVKEVLRDDEIEEYVERTLFRNSIDTLDAHIERKSAISDNLRYSILYLLYEFEQIPRKDLVQLTGKSSNGFEHHIRDLMDSNLIAKVPSRDVSDQRLTIYRITTIGRQEIQADISNIKGNNPEMQSWADLPDPDDVGPAETLREMGGQSSKSPQSESSILQSEHNFGSKPALKT